MLYTKQLNNAALPLEVWALPLGGDPVPIRVSDEGVTAYAGRVSPDGQWVADASEESGPMEIYVRRFPSGGSKYQLTSANAGFAHPRWRKDGRELFFRGGESSIMRMGVTLSDRGVQAGVAERMFERQVLGLADFRRHYDVTPDGQRFIFRPGDTRSASLVVLKHWRSLIAK